MTTASIASQVPGPSIVFARRGEQGYWRRSWRRVRANRLALVMAVIIAFEVVVALAAPWFSAVMTGYGPDQQDLVNTFAQPRPGHWLGTDQLGRDTLTRLIYGAQVSLGVAAMTVAMSATFGTLFGIVAGFYGGVLDTVLMRFVDMLLAIPPIFFFIMLAILFRPNPVGLSVVIASISWVSVARLVRAEVLATKHLDFILAARGLGASAGRLMLRHIFPATLPVVLVAASQAVAAVILAEAALSFLGLGIQPPTPSWGSMITTAQTYFARAVWLAVFPGLAIFVTVLAVTLLGNAIRDALDVSLN
jgi:peptide/nickel transport system permease protein